MPKNRKLLTDRDLQEALDHEYPVKVFKDDHIVDSGGVIIRFDDHLVVVQTSVSQIAYHERKLCEFFESVR